MMKNHYEVLVIGGGISGAAIFYELAKYTDIKKIALFEKYNTLAKLNSKGASNSQTIHCGDIETNYTVDKAKNVKRTAKMVEKYCLQYGYEDKFMFAMQKMAIGVGDEEVAYMRHRYEDFKELFPYLEVFEKDKLAKIEPSLIFDENGKQRDENIVGVGVEGGQYSTVDFGSMTESLVENTIKIEDKQTDVFLNSKIVHIKQLGEMHIVQTATHTYTADFVVVDAGAHSLFLAHEMGHGLDYSCLPMAGSFYLSTKKILKGKVYMVQNPKLPFAALHGDPDILANGYTRFGPTALALPKLERYTGGTYMDFIKTLRFDHNVGKIFLDLLSDSTIRNYVLRNFLFEIPYLNKKFFLKDVRKIVPSLQLEDIEYAKGFGGIRPQVLDKKNQKLMLGEASVNPGTGILFNMTPSPGATSCLGNAERDVKIVCDYLNKTFDTQKFNKDLVD